MDKLKPCPFCGKNPEFRDYGDGWAAYCRTEGCYASKLITFGCVTKQEAYAEWNKRHPIWDFKLPTLADYEDLGLYDEE